MALDRHDERLQSMRGLAALSVLVGHCIWTFQGLRIEDPEFQLSAAGLWLVVIQPFVQANTAVMFFYVLSGLVLGESLRRSQGPMLRRFGAFAVRRAFRLYPVLFAAVLIAAANLLLIEGRVVPGIRASFVTVMQAPVSGDAIVLNMLGIRTDLNTPLWSVQVELAYIAALPVLFAVSSRLPLAFDLAVAAALVAFGIAKFDHAAVPLGAKLVYCFYLGLLLPKAVAAPAARRVLASGIVTLAAVAAVVVIEVAWFFAPRLSAWKYAVDALASFQLLGFVLIRPEAGLSRAMTMRPLVWLGDVSYSLYVFAMPIQFAVIAFVLVPIIGAAPPSAAFASGLTALLVVATTAVALPVAAASYRWIELPAIKLGRITQKALFDRKPSGAPALAAGAGTIAKAHLAANDLR
jgi:peptidoglycan/LPS O-acetylase OafA/YrhL